MPRKSVYSYEEKVKACKDYIHGKPSVKQFCYNLHIPYNGSLTDNVYGLKLFQIPNCYP